MPAIFKELRNVERKLSLAYKRGDEASLRYLRELRAALRADLHAAQLCMLSTNH
jgi:hypothetical protein